MLTHPVADVQKALLARQVEHEQESHRVSEEGRRQASEPVMLIIIIIIFITFIKLTNMNVTEAQKIFFSPQHYIIAY